MSEAKVDETENINFHVSSPYSIFEVLNLCPEHATSRPHCAETDPSAASATCNTTESFRSLSTGATTGFSRIAANANTF